MDQERNKQAYTLAIKHYWEQLRIDWRLTLPGLLLTGVGTIFVIYLPPLIVARLLGKFTSNSAITLSDVTWYLIAFGGLWFIGEMMWRLSIHLMAHAEARGVERLFVNALNYMLEKDLEFFHNNFAGSLTKRTNAYASQYINVVDTLLFNVAPYIIPSFFISFILWNFSPWLVLALFGFSSLTIALIIPLIKRRRRLVVLRETASNKVSGQVSDIYTNIDTVRAFSHEKLERDLHAHNVYDLGKKLKNSWDYQNQKIDMVISPLFVFINLTGLVLSLYIAQNTGAKIEVVFITFTYFSSLTRFLWEFNFVYRRLETALSEAGQFTEMLLDTPKVQDVEKPIDLKVDKGEIEFRNVTFTHVSEADGEALFKKLNIKIKPGEKIGLVGHSGGGKTTFTKLVMRLMDIDDGKILIDGQNIAEAKQSELRKFLSYVPQDPAMFHRSLSDNISYGKPSAEQPEIEKIAKMAHADEFIKKLPKGYKTLVGERGIKLSGGQRQRIAIARAMIKNSPILLLDEATSALDSDSERLIQDALKKLMKDKTTIVIAHRLSTIQNMDRILVLENGEIVEEGSHKELLENDGIYSELWKHQSGGFIEE